jgi:Holliday junction resolvase-like predicted endonuclease
MWCADVSERPKSRQIKFKSREITQTKEHDIHNTAKVWNQEEMDMSKLHYNLLSEPGIVTYEQMEG